MMKTAKELAAAAEAVARNYKTLYVHGCFGAPLNGKNKIRYCSNRSYNKKPARRAKIQGASADTFGFDCCGLIKGLLWGWDGSQSKTYGGATYKSGGVPDYGADKLIQVSSHVSTDFSNIAVGEVVWKKGHIGIYIGGGLAVESTPGWKDGVQITAVHNIGRRDGCNGRKWTKHGKLPYVAYPGKLEEDGKWGEATTRRLQEIFGTTVDGEVSNQWKKYAAQNPGFTSGWQWKEKPNGKGSQLIRKMQAWAGMPEGKRDGEIGPETIRAFQRKLGTTVDGCVSKPSQMVMALQRWANAQEGV